VIVFDDNLQEENKLFAMQELQAHAVIMDIQRWRDFNLYLVCCDRFDRSRRVTKLKFYTMTVDTSLNDVIFRRLEDMEDAYYNYYQSREWYDGPSGMPDVRVPGRTHGRNAERPEIILAGRNENISYLPEEIPEITGYAGGSRWIDSTSTATEQSIRSGPGYPTGGSGVGRISQLFSAINANNLEPLIRSNFT
jgi:hypothetical protein